MSCPGGHISCHPTLQETEVTMKMGVILMVRLVKQERHLSAARCGDAHARRLRRVYKRMTFSAVMAGDACTTITHFMFFYWKRMGKTDECAAITSTRRKPRTEESLTVRTEERLHLLNDTNICISINHQYRDTGPRPKHIVPLSLS